MQPFFPDQKRQLELIDCQARLNQAGEKRIKLDLAMPLTGQALVGMPNYVGDAFEAVATPDNGIVSADSAVELDGMTIEIHSTESSPRALLLTNTLVKKLQIYRVNDKPDSEIKLGFTVYVPANRQCWDWAWEHLGATFYGKFERSQSSLNLKDSEEDSAEDDAQIEFDSGQLTPEEAVKPEHDAEFQPRERELSEATANGKANGSRAPKAHKGKQKALHAAGKKSEAAAH